MFSGVLGHDLTLIVKADDLRCCFQCNGLPHQIVGYRVSVLSVQNMVVGPTGLVYCRCIDSHTQATALALVYQDGYKVRAVSPGERVADGD